MSTQAQELRGAKAHSKAQTAYPEAERPLDCTPDQLDVVRYQLPPDDCARTKRQPWRQECSFSYATRCPENTWLSDYFQKHHQVRSSSSTNKAHNDDDPEFLSLFIGCNKGMDAVDAMRMGSGNAIFDKEAWKSAMSKFGELHFDVCKQSSTNQFPLDRNASGEGVKAELHCIEPMPKTARELNRSAKELGWDANGFIVTHAAIGREDGIASFPGDATAGVENIGLGNGCGSEKCEDVTVYSLDSYVSRHVKGSGAIHYLSIDVEGFDLDVIISGLNNTIDRVRYLEFEYNWMGSWAKQSLQYAVTMLDMKGFTCYWPGEAGKMWRITGCWLDHFDIHMWSNLACINRKSQEMVSIAEDMESLFQSTLRLGKELQITKVG